MDEEPKSSQPNPAAKPGREEFHLELVETGISKVIIWRCAAIAVSVLGLWLIGLATFTDRPRHWLPYNEEILQWLAPEAPDGSEPLELLELNHSLANQQITIQGKIRNRTRQTLEEVIVDIKCWYSHLTIPVEKELPVEPVRMEPGAEGVFALQMPLEGKLTGYSLTFKLANGAVARHKDSRSLSLPE